MVAGGKNLLKPLNEVKWKVRAVNLSVLPAVGLSGPVAPTGVSVEGTKHNQNFWSRFRLLHKHFQRLGKKSWGWLGQVCVLHEPWEGFLTLWVWVPSPGALAGKPRIEQRFFWGCSAWVYLN